MTRGNVIPPVPRRYPDPVRDVVGAEDGPALITAGDHEGAADTGQRVVHHLLERGLPSSRYPAGIQRPGGNQLIDEGALAEGADQHDLVARWHLVNRNGWPDASHRGDVCLQVGHYPDHARVVAAADHERCGLPVPHQRKAPRFSGSRQICSRTGARHSLVRINGSRERRRHSRTRCRGGDELQECPPEELRPKPARRSGGRALGHDDLRSR